MLRKLLLPMLLTLSLDVAAALPAAPFDQESFDAINVAWNENQAAFNADAATVQTGSPEACFVLGKYVVAAFEGAGYSVDETIYTYLKKSGPGTVQMHQFMVGMNLGSVLTQMAQPELANAYEQSGLVTSRTLKLMSRQDPKVPITEADYLLEGGTNPFPIQEDAQRSHYLKTGRIIVGEDDWEGWIVFSPGDIARSTYAIGIVEIAKMSDGEKVILGPLAQSRKKLKVEGTFVRNPGADSFFDRSEDFLIQLAE